MAVFYELVIVGTTTADEFLARVYDDSLPAPVFEGHAADENARLGFSLTLLEGRDGYFEDEDWEIEPARYLDVEFRVDKEADPETVHANVRRFVDRALATGDEDVALINNHFTLMLERVDGKVRRVPSSFWDD